MAHVALRSYATPQQARALLDHHVTCSSLPRHFKLAGVNWYGASDTYHVASRLRPRLLQLLLSPALSGREV